MKTSKRAKRRPRVIGTPSALRRAIANFRSRGRTIALVPTMGALHEGHFSLVRRAQSRADCVVVSIFVNPTQFAPHEDLNNYPRTFAADFAALAERQVALIWAPSARTMYPEGFATRVVHSQLLAFDLHGKMQGFSADHFRCPARAFCQ